MDWPPAALPVEARSLTLDERAGTGAAGGFTDTGFAAVDGSSVVTRGNVTLSAASSIEISGGNEALLGFTQTTIALDQAGIDSTSVNTVQNATGDLTYRRALSDVTYAYATAGILHDDIAQIDYRVTFGPGLGATVWQNDASKLGLEGGIAWADDGDTVTLDIGDEEVEIELLRRRQQMGKGAL